MTEVVSPTDATSELQDKIDACFRAGVEVVWVVYPPQKKIFFHQSPTQAIGLTLNDVLEGGAVVPGFRLPLAELRLKTSPFSPCRRVRLAEESSVR